MTIFVDVLTIIDSSLISPAHQSINSFIQSLLSQHFKLSIYHSVNPLINDHTDLLNQCNLPFKIEIYVHSLCDFNPVEEDGFLTFQRGDIIRILEKPDLEEGWLFGFVHDKRGKFPANYVEEYNPVKKLYVYYYFTNLSSP